jgi:tRNA threonylcarbamoyladenosine biosynthesis protein TsaB
LIVLGFDTATQSTAVGLRLADGNTLQARDDPAPDAHPGHATRLLEMADELLAQAGLGWSALERIAVGVGPGRFTGLRVGVATARGLAQSLGVELVGVSSLQALALPAKSHDDEGYGTRPVLAVIDARRGEAFAAAYTADGEVELPRALGAAELEHIVELVEERGGPHGQRWLAVGDGALRFRAELSRGGAEVAAEDSPLHLIAGAAVSELGARAAGTQTSSAQAQAQVVPDYRRSPDAALARARPAVVTGAGAGGAGA